MGRAFVAAALVAALLAGCGQDGGAGGSGAGGRPLAAKPPRPPAYAPVYPGAVVESSASAGPIAGGTVTFHTSDKPADVIAFYRRTAQSSGLESTFSSQSGDDQLFSAGKKGSDEGLQVIATPAGKGASVQLSWTGSRRG